MTLAKQFAILLAALLVLAALLLAGRNLSEETERGPRWKRRLVGFGLAWLALLGLQAGCRPKSGEDRGKPAGPQSSRQARPHGGQSARQADPRPANPARPGAQPRPQRPRTPRASGRSLDEIQREAEEWAARIQSWKDVARVFRQAEKVARSPRGSYPFDRATKWKLLLGLEHAKKVVQKLADAGRLTGNEAAFLKGEFDAVHWKVSSFRPVEMNRATCYRPMSLSMLERREGDRLQARLRLLQKVAAQKSVDRRVVDLVRHEIESEIQRQPQTTGNAGQRLRRLRQRLGRLWKKVLRKRGR